MKKLNKKGFTLAELLIVVAIIAVLVAISIPVFSAQLEKGREQTDVANLRAAKAAAVVGTMDWKIDVDGVLKDIVSTTSYVYDANKGTFVSNKASTVRAYGKGTTKKGGCDEFILGTETSTSKYTQSTDVLNKVITCKFVKHTSGSKGATYQLKWEAGKTS